MKTKYIKVSVSERLPDKEGDYYVKMRHLSDLQLYYYLDPLHDREYMNKNVEYWLLEVPDYDDEMKEMLEECRLQLEHLNNPSRGTTNSVLSRLGTLLTKLKTES